MRILYYFTNSYPFGIGEVWKYNELNCLKDHFDKIVVIPNSYGGNNVAKSVPSDIEVQKPIIPYIKKVKFKYFDFSLLKLLFRAMLCNSPVKYHLRDFKENKVWTKRTWIKRWLTDLLLTRYYYRELSKRGVIHTNAVFYFFWGSGTASIVPYIENTNIRMIIKYHGADLYKERNNGYFPIRNAQYNSVDAALFISKHGLDYATQHYPANKNKMHLFRLGVYHRGLSVPSKDGVIRIVSCSFLVPVKRVKLIVEALTLCKDNIEWTHIGGGSELEQIKERVVNLPGNVKANLVGIVKPDRVLDFYIDKPVDLFLNVSSSEGIPVSIMEAMSAGIPVYATNVGGTSEIVSDKTGKLLNPNVSPKELAQLLNEFTRLPLEVKLELRNNAFNCFNTCYNGEQNVKAVAEFIGNI